MTPRELLNETKRELDLIGSLYDQPSGLADQPIEYSLLIGGLYALLLWIVWKILTMSIFQPLLGWIRKRPFKVTGYKDKEQEFFDYGYVELDPDECFYVEEEYLTIEGAERACKRELDRELRELLAKSSRANRQEIVSLWRKEKIVLKINDEAFDTEGYLIAELDRQGL